jgi:hypothetical protein
MADKHNNHSESHHADSKHEHHKKKRWPVVLGIVFGLIVVIVLVVYFTIFRVSTPTGTLTILNGNVEVNKGLGFTAVSTGLGLKEGYAIKTLDGNARIVLLDSVILTLDPQTVIKLETIGSDTVVSLDQGTAWSKFIKGNIQSYTLLAKDSNMVAYGTSFKSEVNSDNVILTVSEGTVEFKSTADKLSVPKGKKYILSKGKIAESTLTSEEKASLVNGLKKDKEAIKDLRMDMMQRNKAIYDKLKNMFNQTDKDVLIVLDKIDNGEWNDSELIAKSPINVPIIEKLKLMNDEVKYQDLAIKELSK